jgi:uncharacterized protein DUF4203
MLPHSYEIPAALLLILGGTVACFAGYRLFRVVLAIFGFMFGAWIASSMMGVTNTAGMLVAAILGGLAGALILVFAYFVGIALVGAGLGATVAHVGWTQFRAADPPALAVIALAILGAFGAMWLQRYVIILSTAFVGAWTLIVGALAMAGDEAATRAASAGNVWILYPLTPAPGVRWVPYAWLALGLIGTGVQLGVTGKKS